MPLPIEDVVKAPGPFPDPETFSSSHSSMSGPHQYGDVVSFNILGVNQVLLNTEKAANDLFVQRGNHYSDRGIPTAMAECISKGRVTALIETWRKHRKLLNNVLSSAATTRYEPSIEIETAYTLHDLLSSPDRFSDHIERYAYGLVFRIGLGRSVRSLDDAFFREVLTTIDEGMLAFRADKFACNIWPH
ncbi:hypothetical protein BU23DRAFT_598313 [Bimuria novae-zelandiae CBS 107.79]|uniref:Cytochrome P450 n=1 Tax=Bimuria novae-zelandiae CBS 107.79 TaxID=1447943 RepID=A0A6A5VC18_9PLEO|nr:hypothetical protein BU23DRAFT_598313 [Bimuria novae-zelandiae CBS 107.79]